MVTFSLAKLAVDFGQASLKAVFGSEAANKGREAFDNFKLARSNQELPSLKPPTRYGAHNARSFLSKQVGATRIS